eukprot:GSChrysophyteH1.ASY1.ANO1.493.1 assembled CDS
MALKVKDGLFLGDADTSYDPEFLELNKVSNMINLSGKEVQNIWAAHGLVYLTFLWEDRPNFRIFSDNEADWDGSRLYPPPLGEIVDFIDGSLKHGISVLLFSTKGTGRCVLAMCAYLMCKYQWGFEKAFGLLSQKKGDVSLNQGFIQQLQALDKYLLTQRGGLHNDSDSDLSRWQDWSTSYLPAAGECTEEEEADVEDERLLVNSYLNTRHNAFAAQMILPLKQNRPKLKFNARQLTHVQDGSIRNAPIVGKMSQNLQLRSCLKGKGGSKSKDNIRSVDVDPSLLKGANSKSPQDYDLYGFVGISDAPKTNRPSSAPQQRDYSGSANSFTGMSIEDRLKQMMHNFENVNGNTSASPKRNVAPKVAEEKAEVSAHVVDMQWEAAQDKSHTSSRSFGQRSGNQQNQPGKAPALSLYDLANMPLQPSNQPVRRFGAAGSMQSQYRTQGNISQNSGHLRPDAQPKATNRPASASKAVDGLGAKDDDPLAAFGGFGGGGNGNGSSTAAATAPWWASSLKPGDSTTRLRPSVESAVPTAPQV